MRPLRLISLIVFTFLLFSNTTFAQLTSFQKIYLSDHFTTCFDVAPTLDQGYIITGFEDRPAPFNMPLVPYLTKINCRGEVEWMKKYGATTMFDNTDPRVTTLNEGDYIMMSTVVQNGLDILVTRTTPDGQTLWQKVYGGSQKDVGRGMLKTADDNIVVVGTTESYGTDTGTPYVDMYALKINSTNGDTIWTRTYGNPDGIDDLWGLVEADNGELTFVGRSFYDEGIWLSILRADASGKLKWSKVIGKTNHHTQGFDIQAFENGDLVVTGFTTIAEVDFNSWGDLPVIRLDSDGNILWSTVLHGSNPNFSELGSTIVIDDNFVAVALESLSYPSDSPDVTKRMIYLLEKNTGAFAKAIAFNGSGGQFPMIRKDWDGYIMSGFTDEFPGSWNDPILVKLDNNFESGCSETELTNLTFTEFPVFDVANIDYTSLQGAVVTDYLVDSTGTLFRDSTLCFSGEIPVECEPVSSNNDLNIGLNVDIYPNPTSNLLNIAFNDRIIGQTGIELYSLQGALLEQRIIDAPTKLNIDLRPYPSGTYALKIITKQGLLTQKVIKL